MDFESSKKSRGGCYVCKTKELDGYYGSQIDFNYCDYCRKFVCDKCYKYLVVKESSNPRYTSGWCQNRKDPRNSPEAVFCGFGCGCEKDQMLTCMDCFVKVAFKLVKKQQQ